MTSEGVVGLTLEDLGYLRELLANKADAEQALARAEGEEAHAMARDALRNADAFWQVYGVPLMHAALDVAERTLKAAGNRPDIRRAHAIVLTAEQGGLAHELRVLAARLDAQAA